MRPRRFTRGWSPSYNYNSVREHGKKIVKEPKSKLEKELDTKKFISKQCLKFGVEEKLILNFYDKNKKVDKTITYLFKSSKIKNKCKELEILDKNYYIFLCKNNSENLDDIIEVLNVTTGIFKELKKREIKFDSLDLIKIVKRYNSNFGDVYNWFFKENITSKIIKKSNLNDSNGKENSKNSTKNKSSVKTLKINLIEANKICELLNVEIEENQLIELVKISSSYNTLFNSIQNYITFFKLKPSLP